MQPSFLRRNAIAVLLAVFATAAVSTDRGAGAAGVCGWRMSLQHFSGPLNDVWSSSPRDVWAVGRAVDEQTTIARPSTIHWNGGAWKQVDVPEGKNGPTDLYAASFASPTDGWAVGRGEPSDATARWDGATWKVVHGPDFGQHVANLFDVDVIAGNDAWAVGTFATKGSIKGHVLVEHWDGTRWNIVPTPDVGQSELLAVAAVSRDNVWAVGNRVYKTLIEHWNGLRWTVVANPAAPYGFLTGIVALSPRNIWAVGGRYLDTARTKQNSLIEHWDGTTWWRAASPFRPGTVVSSISARSSGDVWIGGVDPVSLAPVALAHRVGTTWRVVQPLHVKGGLGLVVSAAAMNDVWAMGNVWSNADSSDHGFVEHYGCR